MTLESVDHFLGQGIVFTVKAVFDILLMVDLIIFFIFRVGQLVTVGTFLSSGTGALGEKAAQIGFVTIKIGYFSS